MNNYSINKNRVRYIVILLSSFALFSVIFTLCGGFNGISVADETSKAKNEIIETPIFSEESGFYDEPFYLTLEVPEGMQVYYTLDCTDPSEKSILYTAPIYLDEATPHENVFCTITDVSTGFYSDLIDKYNTIDPDPHYAVPDYQVEKCNIVKAVAVTKDHKMSRIITKTYFVGTDASIFDGVNIACVTTDPNNLFDPNYGIYVTGDKFNNTVLENNSHWRLWDANYRQKGKAWERDCCVSLFDRDGGFVYEYQNSTIRIQGGVSRGTVPRSLNLYAETESGDESFFELDLFNSGYKPHSFTLACGGNCLYTKFNDYMISSRCSDLNFSTMEYKPYILFLDGEYWGFYWMAERYDETYFSHYYNVEKDNVLVIKNGEVECGDKIYKSIYSKMIYDISSRDMKLQSNYDYACSVIDIDSFIDYFATMAYISRQDDWPRSNFELWRSIEVNDDKYADGKWRWVMFDCNSLSMRKDIINDNSLQFILENDTVFASLWENNQFKKQFKNRLFEIADSCFDSTDMIDFVDTYNQQMLPILQKSWERFHGKGSNIIDQYCDDMNGYKEFFEKRRTVVESWFTNQ